MMDRLISLNAAIDAVCKACFVVEDYHKCDGYPETSTWCEQLVALRALPSAQPEIIRCKDCKHRPTATRADEGVLWGWSVEFPDEICPLQCEDGWYNYYPKDDFYCANAERRTDE